MGTIKVKFIETPIEKIPVKHEGQVRGGKIGGKAKVKKGFAVLGSDAAANSGKKGGSAKVPKGFATMTKEERTRRAKEASNKRWKGAIQK